MMTFTLEEVFSSIYRVADTLPTEIFSKSNRFGEHKSQFKGDGHDFDRIVEYDPAIHSISQIDWRSMTRNKVYVRESRVTKDFPIIIMGDLSTSMVFGVNSRQYKERMFLEAFGDIGLACFHAQDPMGLIGFGEEIIFNESPKVGEDNVFYLIEQLYGFFDGLSSDGRGKLKREKTDFYNALDFLMRMYANTSCMVIVLSDFIGLENISNFKIIEDAAAQHELVFIFLDDPTEFEASQGFGYVKMEDMETGETVVVSRRKMNKLNAEIRQKRKLLRHKLREFSVDSMVLEYGKHFQRLHRFFLSRQEIFK